LQLLGKVLPYLAIHFQETKKWFGLKLFGIYQKNQEKSNDFKNSTTSSKQR